jgi:hypothetical protein
VDGWITSLGPPEDQVIDLKDSKQRHESQRRRAENGRFGRSARPVVQFNLEFRELVFSLSIRA